MQLICFTEFVILHIKYKASQCILEILDKKLYNPASKI
uniref:Uncharacterized protein n=1 Tax=Anguilla anguilla TaxID=7936 RepID=A0A0E9SKQ6_ANGAN